MRKQPTYWDKVKREIRPKFARVGLLNVCELGWEGCTGKITDRLTFAHSLRRREIDKYKKQGNDHEYERRMREVIRCCSIPCHAKLDARKHEETEAIVLDIIANRRRQPE